MRDLMVEMAKEVASIEKYKTKIESEYICGLIKGARKVIKG